VSLHYLEKYKHVSAIQSAPLIDEGNESYELLKALAHAQQTETTGDVKLQKSFVFIHSFIFV